MAEAVAEAEEALLGAGLLLIAPRAADAAVEPELLDGRQQRWDLQAIAADLAGRWHRRAVGDGALDGADDELAAQLRGAAVTELVQLGEVVPGVDVEQRHRDIGWTKGLLREAEQADRVLAAREEQGRPLKAGGDFAHHVDGLCFQILEVIEMVTMHWVGLNLGFPTSD